MIDLKKFKQLAIAALDKIYNESPEARKAVIKYYGALHPPYNDKFKRFCKKPKLNYDN